MRYREIWRILLLVVIYSAMTSGILYAQRPAGNPGNGNDFPHLSINLLNGFHFGSFFPGSSGGSVILNYDGQRTASGDIVLLANGIVSPALFEIRSRPKAMIQLSFDDEIPLMNENGETILLLPGELSMGNPFIAPNGAPSGFTISMGGTVVIGNINQNPPGEYSGTFLITMIVE